MKKNNVFVVLTMLFAVSFVFMGCPNLLMDSPENPDSIEQNGSSDSGTSSKGENSGSENEESFEVKTVKAFYTFKNCKNGNSEQTFTYVNSNSTDKNFICSSLMIIYTYDNDSISSLSICFEGNPYLVNNVNLAENTVCQFSNSTGNWNGKGKVSWCKDTENNSLVIHVEYNWD